MKKRFLSFLLASALIFTQVSALATEDTTTGDTTGTETVSDSFELEVSPENYAIVNITKSGYGSHTKNAKALSVYYNQVFSSGSIYSEFASVISSYKVPVKEALDGMKIEYQIGSTSQLVNNKAHIPVFYDLNKFSIDAEPGVYLGPVADDTTTDENEAAEATAEYQAALAYTANYWPASYSYSSTNFASKVAYKINTSTTGWVSHDITSTAMTALLADETADYITLSTGRETSKYANFTFNVKSSDQIPKLTLTYSKDSIVKYINSTTEAGIAQMLEGLNEIGALAGSTVGYEGYDALGANAKKYVDKQIYSVIAAGGYADFDAFIASYDAVVGEAAEATSEGPVLAKVLAENYATIYLENTGSHSSTRALDAYYNTLYSANLNIYAEFGSIISGYKVLLKDALTNMTVNHYFGGTVGGMSNGHIPVFYDINRFVIDAEAGKYTGPRAATDTTEATEASTVYATIKDYTTNYWVPEYTSGEVYSYENTNFAEQLAFKVTSAVKNTVCEGDVTETALAAFLADETAEYITFATGRESHGDVNCAFSISTATKIPYLTLTYDAEKLVNYINKTASASELDTLITTLYNAGILDENTSKDYAGYTGLTEEYREDVCADIYEEIANGGYLKFTDFAAAYDKAINDAVNGVINKPVAYINFDDGTANDQTENELHAQIVGDAQFVTGANGTKALKITNEFGKIAQQYLNMGEYDFGEENFSIVFWMRAPERGVEYEETGDSIDADAIVDFSTYTGSKGGVVVSNKDFSTPDNTGFAFAAMPVEADFAYNMKVGENATINADGYQRSVDSRWHQISFVVNRAGNAILYVDNTAIKTVDISELSGTLGSGDLIFGADGLGQYGMMKGEFDEIKIYNVALEASRIEELYYINALNKLNNDISEYLNSDSIEFYSNANVAELTSKLAASKEFVQGYEVGSLSAISAYYSELETYYNNFLNKDVNTVAAFGSDIHISEPSETHISAKNMQNALAESAEWENPAKTIIFSGDVADVGADDLKYFFSHLGKWHVDGTGLVICRGNHDEPKGTDKTTGIEYSRGELKQMWLDWMDGYIDKSLGLNQSVLNEDGAYALPYYYSTDGAAHYISLDNYNGSVRTIDAAQFAWLETVLDTVSGDGKPIFVVQHLPLRDTTKGSNNETNGLLETTDTKLKALLKQYDNIFVLNGHSHHGFGNGSGTPFYVGDEEGGFWQINTSILASKAISRGYEWGSGYYINVRDGEVTFRARDFENQKWLYDYDMTFALAAPTKTVIDEINLIDATAGTEYATVAAAAGKAIKVQAPVTFIDETATSFETAFAAYAGGVLKAAKLGSVAVTDSYIEFELTLPADTDEVKVMCWNTIESMVPVCAASVK